MSGFELGFWVCVGFVDFGVVGMVWCFSGWIWLSMVSCFSGLGVVLFVWICG